MRAALITSLDGPQAVTVTDVEEPSSGDGVLIDVDAAGVAFPDLLQTRGLYQLRPELPFVPGMEVAGRVRQAPEAAGLEVGQRVMAVSTIGGFAEVVAAPVDTTYPVPDRLDDEAAAGFVVNYHTAHFALHRRGRLRDGETVLVHGAAGGVGVATIQVAKAAGARVLAAVSTDEKAAVAGEAGADGILLTDDDWVEATKDATDGRGADVIMDPVGGERLQRSIRCLAPEGRLLVVGFTSGTIPEVKVNRLLLRNVDLVGVAWGEYIRRFPPVGHELAAALNELVDRGAIDPPVGATYPLDEVVAALTDLEERRATRKIVLRVRDGADG